jgi:hypothetical protein
MPLTLDEARAVLRGDRPGPGHVLGIDQATQSGWALVDLETGRCTLSGAVAGPRCQEGVLSRLADVTGLHWASTLVVLEDHSTIPAGSGIPTSSILSLGDSRGRWCALLSQAGQPEEARMLAAPDVWRRLLGTRGYVGRAAWKMQACLWARAITGRAIQNDDEAEAVVIAMWGAREGLVRWASARAEQTRRIRRKGKGKP